VIIVLVEDHQLPGSNGSNPFNVVVSDNFDRSNVFVDKNGIQIAEPIIIEFRLELEERKELNEKKRNK
jgi:hypothetical protein